MLTRKIGNDKVFFYYNRSDACKLGAIADQKGSATLIAGLFDCLCCIVTLVVYIFNLNPRKWTKDSVLLKEKSMIHQKGLIYLHFSFLM